eukprot:Hpha_TRINITY_DN27410_c0_g1::TRINITY_DN27410_c0_g1_i1::g.193867::m.193867
MRVKACPPGIRDSRARTVDPRRGWQRRGVNLGLRPGRTTQCQPWCLLRPSVPTMVFLRLIPPLRNLLQTFEAVKHETIPEVVVLQATLSDHAGEGGSQLFVAFSFFPFLFYFAKG